MSRSSPNTLKPLHNLENIPDLTELSTGPLKPDPEMGVNTHLHLPPNFSAFENAGHLVRLAKEQNVQVLGISNYYDFDVYEDFALKCSEQNIFPLFGLEIIYMDDVMRNEGIRANDPENPGKVYICGKGISRFRDLTTEASRLITIIRRNDTERMTRMIGKMNEIFRLIDPEIAINPGEVITTIASRCGAEASTVYIQERHVALAFQEWLFEHVTEDHRKEALSGLYRTIGEFQANDPVGIQSNLRKNLMKSGGAAFVDEKFIHYDNAVRLILELGGVPVYPVLIDGSDPICEFEVSPEALIRKLKKMGFHAVEFIPIRNTHAILEKYATMLYQADFVVTAGTEHNTLNLTGIAPTCLDGVTISNELKSIFQEGACVMIAHQHLQFHGRRGYIDENNQPYPGFGSSRERKLAFARLGQSVLDNYFYGSSTGEA